MDIGLILRVHVHLESIGDATTAERINLSRGTTIKINARDRLEGKDVLTRLSLTAFEE